MTLFCKYIRCFRLARDGKRACRKHQCSEANCIQPVHLKCSKCFNHFGTGAINTTLTFNNIGNDNTSIVFGGQTINLGSSNSMNEFMGFPLNDRVEFDF